VCNYRIKTTRVQRRGYILRREEEGKHRKTLKMLSTMENRKVIQTKVENSLQLQPWSLGPEGMNCNHVLGIEPSRDSY
jgi:hypothetical protein